MKLAIFIPAYNEETTIGSVIAAIPAHVPHLGHLRHVSDIKIFVVDDGSADQTAQAAQKAGADRDGEPVGIIQIKPNRGLANAFKVGLQVSLDWGADLITHLDADGQYDPAEIPLLLEPILNRHADMVTGNRQIERIKFLGWPRRYGNMAGSWFLRALAGLQVRDVSCGFRAYNRDAASKLEVYSEHTYTHETLIEAKFKGIRISEVPVTFRPRTDTSRLTGNLFKHISRCLTAIFAARRRYGKF